jgi:class 3 adenylate cyclase
MHTTLKVIMFTDQVESTRHMARRPPAEIMRVDREQGDLTAEVARQYGGTILKDTGDGAIIEFSSCTAAVQCGFILQQHVKARNRMQSNDRLKFELHIGIDFGEVVVLPNGDLRGNAANRAARVCALCPPGEVYFTEKMMQELHPHVVRVAKVDLIELKGVEGRINIYRLIECSDATEPVRNPFVWRNGITKAEDFFNRHHEEHRLRAFLQNRQNCQIVGARRIGKTSLLRHIERAAPAWEAATMVAYLDLQDPRCFTLGGWLERAGRQFGWSPSPENLAAFAECVEHELSEDHRLLLCLDEFEEITARRHEFHHDFLLTLRACGQQGMSIVTTSQRPLSELTDPQDRTSPFYNTFPLLSVGPFADPDAADFVILDRPGIPPLSREEQTAILDFAAGHPLALQVAYFHVLEAKEGGEGLAVAMCRADDNMRAHLPTW